MESKKESARVRLTKQMLRQAFTSLLMEKPIQNITVRELCEKAQVNRGTFYTHYADIYDLMESIERQMTQQLGLVIKELNVSLKNENGLLEAYCHVFEFLKQNSDMCIILLGENSDFAFLNRLLAMGKDYSLKQYMEAYPQATPKQAEYFYSFISSGCIGLLRQWMANNFRDSTRSVAVMAQNLVLGAVKALTIHVEWG